MNNKYKLVKITETGEIEKEYKTLNEIANETNIEIHIIRKINKMTENIVDSKRPHHCHKDLYDKIKIYNIKKTYNV